VPAGHLPGLGAWGDARDGTVARSSVGGQLQVPLVKTVYVLLHRTTLSRLAKLYQSLRDLAPSEKVCPLLQGHIASISHPPSAQAKRVHAFWDGELPASTIAGCHWRSILALAESNKAPFPYDELADRLAAMLEARGQWGGCIIPCRTRRACPNT
jgi:hypothetical protein